jgi:hypothetical protein
LTYHFDFEDTNQGDQSKAPTTRPSQPIPCESTAIFLQLPRRLISASIDLNCQVPTHDISRANQNKLEISRMAKTGSFDQSHRSMIFCSPGGFPGLGGFMVRSDGGRIFLQFQWFTAIRCISDPKVPFEKSPPQRL